MTMPRSPICFCYWDTLGKNHCPTNCPCEDCHTNLLKKIFEFPAKLLQLIIYGNYD